MVRLIESRSVAWVVDGGWASGRPSGDTNARLPGVCKSRLPACVTLSQLSDLHWFHVYSVF